MNVLIAFLLKGPVFWSDVKKISVLILNYNYQNVIKVFFMSFDILRSNSLLTCKILKTKSDE